MISKINNGSKGVERMGLNELCSSLIGGMDINEFNSRIREKVVYKFGKAIPKNSLNDIFRLKFIEDLLYENAINIKNIDLYKDKDLKKIEDVDAGGSNLSDKVRWHFMNGYTIRIRDLQDFEPVINDLCINLKIYFAANVQANIYLTPPKQEGFPPHWDITDVFILQCSGSKSWNLFNDYKQKVELPLAGTPWEPSIYKPIGTPLSLILNPGDSLYLPRGSMHQANCLSEGSVHLAFSISPLTYANFLCDELLRLSQKSVHLRGRINWSTQDSQSSRHILEQEVKELFSRLIDQIDLLGRLEKEQTELMHENGFKKEFGVCDEKLTDRIFPFFE